MSVTSVIADIRKVKMLARQALLVAKGGEGALRAAQTTVVATSMGTVSTSSVALQAQAAAKAAIMAKVRGASQAANLANPEALQQNLLGLFPQVNAAEKALVAYQVSIRNTWKDITDAMDAINALSGLL